MRAPHIQRPRFDTLDYEADEAVTDLIVPLTTRTFPVPKQSTTRLRAVAEPTPTPTPTPTLARNATPMIVDKNQLVAIARVLRTVPETVPTRIPRLSWLVIEGRASDHRRARHRTWLVRIAVVASLELLSFAVTRPAVGALLHDCVTQSWCSAAQ